MRKLPQAIQTKVLADIVSGVVSAMILGEDYAEKKA